MDKNKVVIFDTTLRDGEQTPGVNLNLTEKLEIARQLEALGVDIIEAGFPAASEGDFEAVRNVAENVGCTVAALCRCAEADIRRGWEAVKTAKKPRLHVFLATSELHMVYKLKMSKEEVLESVARNVAFAKTLCDDIEFSCEDASRSEAVFLFKVLETAIDAGAATLNIPDTVGYAVPAEYGALIKSITEKVRGIEKAVISVHCHDDLGLAVANTIAALENGARQVECTVNGIGERAGNCSMEEVVCALKTRAAVFGLATNIDTTKIYRTSQRVSALTGVAVSPYKSIVGTNAFAHASGIHQHGVLANPMTYEIMTPESVGKTESTLVLGKLSGRHAFSDRLRELGYTLSDTAADTAFTRFKALADRKKDITDDDLEALVNQIMDIPEYYLFDSFQIQSGNKMLSMACVTLVHDGTNFMEAAFGSGPVDAAYNAVALVVGGQWPLASYAIKAVTAGRDALGEVTVRVEHNGETHIGRGLSADIIEASILAYVNAINRAITKKTLAKTPGPVKN